MNVKNYVERHKKNGSFFFTAKYMFKTWYLLQPLLGTQKLPAACAKVTKELLTAVVSNSYTLGSGLLT